MEMRLVAIPFVRFFLATPPGTKFNGFYTFSVDYYAYLAWIRQAHDGAESSQSAKSTVVHGSSPRVGWKHRIQVIFSMLQG